MIYEEILRILESEHRLRHIPPTQHGLDLVSNDYMGLAKRYEDFLPEFIRNFSYAQMSASASRLLQRSQDLHFEFESRLEQLYGKPVLLTNSGYHANVGALSALSVPGTLIVSDKLAHASMIDGIRLGHGDTLRFPHNDMGKLRMILEKKAKNYRNVLVVTESVFSMDGDLAPLQELVGLKKDYPNLLLYVDEAHAYGVFGERGLGVAEERGLIGKIDFLIVTLGKAAAGYGAFIVTSDVFKSYLINCSRSFIFSTALPPSVIAWDGMMVDTLLEMKEERAYLRSLSKWFRQEMEKISCLDNQSRSQIIPVHAGSAEKAIEMASRLRESGIDVLPIRRPTVAAGTERLRISLSAILTKDELCRVPEILNEIL